MCDPMIDVSMAAIYSYYNEEEAEKEVITDAVNVAEGLFAVQTVRRFKSVFMWPRT